ncbi:MAG: phosphoribosylformylglycinamidine synthase subunit PurS [Actinomycetota bacterium]|nr:phosphoribosylformylglycinamidine synthase subunit PurS [Actinomycetota bacterium]
MQYEACVEVLLREGIADPQGSTIENATSKLGFNGISNVRVGKSIRFTLESESEETAQKTVQELCDRFLTNPVIESATILIQGSE